MCKKEKEKKRKIPQNPKKEKKRKRKNMVMSRKLFFNNFLDITYNYESPHFLKILLN